MALNTGITITMIMFWGSLPISLDQLLNTQH